MKRLLIVLTIAFLVQISLQQGNSDTNQNQNEDADIDDEDIDLSLDVDVERVWKSFKSKHKKHYKNTTEDTERKQRFVRHAKRIKDHNDEYIGGKRHFWLKVTKNADRSWDDIKKTRMGLKQLTTKFQKQEYINLRTLKALETTTLAPLPASWDWRTQGCSTPVKDQGNCGCCWTFATASVVECAVMIKKNSSTVMDFSEQQLLDCVSPKINCETGSDYPTAFATLQNKAISPESDYNSTYIGQKNAVCLKTFKPENYSLFDFDGYRDFAAGPAENDMMRKLVTYGPLAIAVGVHDDEFRFYAGGIFSGTLCNLPTNPPNHAVVLFGYGEENGIPYWLVKNSWGTYWGDGGYIKIKRGVNMCKIGMEFYYVKVNA